jgi:hypothetical protein
MRYLRWIVPLFLFALIAMPATAQQGAPSSALSWNSVTVPTQSALQYKVQRATVLAGPYTTIGTVAVMNYTDLTVTRGTVYFWRVLSSCPTTGAGCGTTASPLNGDSAPSSTVTAQIPNVTQTPPVPTNLTLDSVQ